MYVRMQTEMEENVTLMSEEAAERERREMSRRERGIFGMVALMARSLGGV
jgi:hypothetical protein